MLMPETLIKFRKVCLFISNPCVNYWFSTNFSAMRILINYGWILKRSPVSGVGMVGGHRDVAFDM